MELQFQETAFRCLRSSAADTRSAEQTLEVRLPENMPPISRVLGAWGQPLIRGKEWGGDQASVNGGVMAHALYEGEDGGVHCVEGWIPFQLKWELQDSQQDGTMMVGCLIRSVDARQIGAEKLMLRCSVSAAGQAMEKEVYSLYSPGQLPEDVQILQEKHPVCVPMEAGEQPLTLEEDMLLGPGAADVEKILFYELMPAVKEKKVMADKMVFRGSAQLHMVYMGTDGMIHAFDTQVPMSQYGELEQEYGPDAEIWVEPVVTDLEMERTDDGRLRMRAGILGQYVICDRPEIVTVRDVYSTQRPVQLQSQQLMLPNILDSRREAVSISQTVPGQAERIVACNMNAAQPRVIPMEQTMEMEGTTGLLYYDAEGRPQSVVTPFQQAVDLPTGRNARMFAMASPLMEAQAAPGVEDMTVQGSMEVSTWAMDSAGIPMVTGLTLGEEISDSGRPSLILRKPGELSLWELAKKCGSTVEAICSANDLAGEPESDRMLLIPVQ